MNTAVLRLRNRRRVWTVLVTVVAIVVLGALISLSFRTAVVERERAARVVQVVIPPPPPPPPPPPREQKVVEETVPQDMPMEAPSEAPPEANDALTAREGLGPNYGQQAGDGSGLRVGGRPGQGDAARAYGVFLTRELQRVLQADEGLTRGRYAVQLQISVNADGVVESVRFVTSSGDARRDTAIERLFVGVRLSRPPPPHLPTVLVAYQSRPGA